MNKFLKSLEITVRRDPCVDPFLHLLSEVVLMYLTAQNEFPSSNQQVEFAFGQGAEIV